MSECVRKERKIMRVCVTLVYLDIELVFSGVCVCVCVVGRGTQKEMVKLIVYPDHFNSEAELQVCLIS